MRLLFATIQGFESAFYGQVADGLARRGHEVEHLTYSRLAARRLTAGGRPARALADLLPALGPVDVTAERRRIEARYGETLRSAWETDPACAGRPEAWCDEQAVRHYLAVERLLDDCRPDAVIPEVGVELVRTVVHRVALDRGIPTLFLFYTIFPRPLRLYIDTMHAPIVAPAELRELTAAEGAEVDEFVAGFTAAAQPIRRHRRHGLTSRRLSRLAGYVAARAATDRDNLYLAPGSWLTGHAREWVRRRAAARLYRPLPSPVTAYVYFPLHVADDYKIRRVVPHLADQAAIVKRLAAALPPGVELVVKEHPLSIGRNPLPWLRGLAALPGVRLVGPHASSHDLVRGAQAVAVIGSTVGLEALLYGKPVLTIGRPFYAGLGVTLDVDTPEEAAARLPELLGWAPDPETVRRVLGAAMRRCYDGAPVLVDDSPANAERLAAGLAAGLADLQAAAGRAA